MSITEILSNSFFKSIFIPILLALLSALLEYTLGLAKGRSNQNSQYRVWVKEQDSNTPRSYIKSLNFIRSENNFIHVENLISPEWSEFGSVANSLIIGAFAVDITSLIDFHSINQTNSNVLVNQTSPILIGVILLIHLFLLLLISLFLILNNQTSPLQQSQKNNYVKLAILSGLIAMFLAYFATDIPDIINF